MTKDSGREDHTPDATLTSRSRRAPALPGRRDAGDAWVEGADGARYWGRFGAAGLLVHDPSRGVLLQHRATWSHHGDTWGIPGGALHEGETAFDGACREAAEEGDVPRDAVAPVAMAVLDREVWRYTTVLGRATERFEARALDAESHELRWVPLKEVARLPLHPSFGAAWELHRALLAADRVLIVDAANVVGARPDGWWRDRAGATSRLLERLRDVTASGIALADWARVDADGLTVEGARGATPVDTAARAADAGLSVRVLPRIVVVVEGQAREAVRGGAAARRGGQKPGHSGIGVVPAAGSGDDAIVDEVRSAVVDEAREQGDERNIDVVVVTSDRELQARVRDAGARAAGARWLLTQLDGLDSDLRDHGE
ncbi:NUDIX hydrolase [Demequina sp. NBRC 110055]|uniref:NUDIX hydrolase n=1 Tax=Demequina sp. NBRC 110055 TaxID=1570344 RepID=UPI0027D79DA9|nr:NUDIX hydrolase [Demequina sp. NBRC 110055]